MIFTATYSPEDNKLRLTASSRLDTETYNRVKAAGFSWAPRQGIFVAPMWTPSREDLAMELAGEIGDEDTTLVDRAEERAERFEDYSESRLADATQARATVKSITDHIPFGQPILVGHHSERRARKDVERIEGNMRRAVKMWDTAQYWQSRAEGALRHAKYKERPDVRYRRIKGLEADVRRVIASYTPQDSNRIMQQRWNAGPDAPKIAHAWCGQARGGRWVPVEDLPRLEAGSQRWLNHYNNRIAYERAMLGESGGLVGQQQEIQVGGRVLTRDEWVTVLRVNRKDGQICSVRTSAKYCSLCSVEDIKDYEAPTEEHAAKVADAMKKPAICNYPGEGFYTCTEEEWKKIGTEYKSTRTIEATATTAAHRVRVAISFRLHKPANYTPPTTETGKWSEHHSYPYVYITDGKRKDPPAAALATSAPVARVIQPNEPVLRPAAARPAFNQEVQFTRASIDEIRDALKTGVQVVAVPQLFPTPPELAARMVELAEIEPGHRVLEPSAGTGNIVEPVFNNTMHGELVAVEINADLARRLSTTTPPRASRTATSFNKTATLAPLTAC